MPFVACSPAFRFQRQGLSHCGQRLLLLLLRMMYQSSTLFAIDIEFSRAEPDDELLSALVSLLACWLVALLWQAATGPLTLRPVASGAAHGVPALEPGRRYQTKSWALVSLAGLFIMPPLADRHSI